MTKTTSTQQTQTKFESSLRGNNIFLRIEKHSVVQEENEKPVKSISRGFISLTIGESKELIKEIEKKIYGENYEK